MTGFPRLLAALILCWGLSFSVSAALPASLMLMQGRTIVWQTEFEKALKKAKTEKRILFVAINMAGERANDEAVRVHYRDSRILSLAKHSVNLFATADRQGASGQRFPGLSWAQANRIEMRVREQFLKIPADTDVVAPQHLFISPQGKILLSVPYQITVGELEWMFAEALSKNDPQFKWTLDGRARAPMRLKYGYQKTTPAGNKAPSKEEVQEVLDDLRKGRVDFWDIADQVGVIIRSDNEDAIKYVKSFIHSRWVRTNSRIDLIEAIGKSSPKPWYVIVDPFVGDKKENVREAAIVAMAALGEKKGLKTLKKQLKKEKDATIEGRCLRAMAKLAPKDKSVISAIKKVLKNTKSSEELRMHAIVAAGLLENRKVVSDVLAMALADPSAKPRSTAAYAIAVRRDKELLENLRAVLEREKNLAVKHWLTSAVKAIEGSNDEAFKDFLKDIVGDSDSRRNRRERERQGGRRERRRR